MGGFSGLHWSVVCRRTNVDVATAAQQRRESGKHSEGGGGGEYNHEPLVKRL